MTTYFHPSNKELARGYGYAPSSNNLDQSVVPWTDLEWSRPLEIACTIVAGVEQSAEPSIDGMTADDTCPELNDIHDWILAIKARKTAGVLTCYQLCPIQMAFAQFRKKASILLNITWSYTLKRRKLNIQAHHNE